MVLMRFTKFTNKVRRKLKRQTVRKPRKNPIKVGDRLQIYVTDYLGEATVLTIRKKPIGYVTVEDAEKDGFESIYECQQALMEMHKCGLSEEFDLITYDPHWEPTVVVPVKKLEDLTSLVKKMVVYPRAELLALIEELKLAIKRAKEKIEGGMDR